MNKMNVLAFDIETIPDTDAGRRLHDLGDLSDKDVAQVMFTKRRQQTDSEFLPLHLQRVVAISAVLRSGDVFKVWSLGTVESDEAELITRFFEGIERYTPTLVSWNGSAFDLPVLHYRSLVHGIPAARYWDVGDEDRDFRWNNYLNRFHYRHTDLMDVISGYQARAFAPLAEIAVLLGFPGKLGKSGAEVWQQYLDGKLQAIRDYCETDVVNTYLVYLRWQLIRGQISRAGWKEECERVRSALRSEAKPHWEEFLRAWQ